MTGCELLAATSIGEGILRVCRSIGKYEHCPGLVVGSFSSGFYVRTDQFIFAVGGPKIAAGPIHLVLEHAPSPPPDRSPVYLQADRLVGDCCVIELSRASSYKPIQPSLEQLKRIAPMLARLARLVTVSDDIAHIWPAVIEAVYQSDLHGARVRLQGLGRGLTPTGDDVLAGLILFSHWAQPTSSVPQEIAAQALTTDLSRCFLAWAAVGQSIQPIHALVDATDLLLSSGRALGDDAALVRFDRAVAAVASIGGTSGKALLLGLGLAAAAWVTRHSLSGANANS